MKFFVAFFCTFLLLVATYLGLYRVIDPRGQFGTGIFPAPLANARVSKQKKLRAYEKTHAVNSLILGSSRSMLFDPAVIDKKTGLVFFNFAVENAMVEDYLAVYRWVKSQGVKPKMLIVGLDVEALNNSNKMDERLQDNPALYNALKGAPQSSLGERLRLMLSEASNALTIQNAMAMFQGIKLKVRPAPQTDIVQPDGHTEYPVYEKMHQAGTWDLQAKISETIPGYSAEYKDMTSLSDERKAQLLTLVKEATGDGAKTILWIPPLHPVTVKKLAEATPYPARLMDTIHFAESVAAQYPRSVFAVDLSTPERFGGNDSDWRDGAHMNKKNAELALEKMLGATTGGL
jgi:hypothetical protein